ncbi:MAG: fibrobacter succinogenes major paralogous domain-containing protein [Prevotellaceae bacterium]|nr:fibrobacter succinogenes major paralogous domain-containing protein [Prevotellaceae bacterium]
MKLTNVNRRWDSYPPLLTSIPGYQYGDCMNATNSSTPARGYLYDWAGAIQKAGAYFGSSSDVGCSGVGSGTSGTNPGACQGICPEGWHIPTGDYSNGEYQALHTAIGGCVTTNDDCWDASSAWEGVYGGYYSPNGALYDQGSCAYYGSST